MEIRERAQSWEGAELGAAAGAESSGGSSAMRHERVGLWCGEEIADYTERGSRKAQPLAFLGKRRFRFFDVFVKPLRFA